MRQIVKNEDPARFKDQSGSGPGPGGRKDVKRSLVREQRGLCCYCLSRIRAERGGAKVEYWHCRASYPDEKLDYSNLLAACMGNEGGLHRDHHCDTRKGHRDLSRNPANPEHRIGETIRFLGDGRIISTDAVFNAEINDVLNLNLAFLRASRKATISALEGWLRKASRRGKLSRGAVEEKLRRWNGDSAEGDLQPFCQVAVYWLRKRLART